MPKGFGVASIFADFVERIAVFLGRANDRVVARRLQQHSAAAAVAAAALLCDPGDQGVVWLG